MENDEEGRLEYSHKTVKLRESSEVGPSGVPGRPIGLSVFSHPQKAAVAISARNTDACPLNLRVLMALDTPNRPAAELNHRRVERMTLPRVTPHI